MESTSQGSVITDAVKNYAPTESETDDFTLISDEDEDYNLLLWQAFAGPPPSLPKKGDLVVYFPQGHLEYAASDPSSSLPPTEAPTFDLKSEIICRVVHVQLLVSKKNDKVHTKMTLLPAPEMVGVNLKGKELQELVVDEKGDGGSPSNSTPPLFSKKLTASDKPGKFLIPTKDAENVFPPLMEGVNLMGKELQWLVVDEKGDGGSPANSTSHLFSEKLTASDKPGKLLIPTEVVENDFPLDSTPHLFYKKLTASDLRGRILIPTKDAENVLPPLDNKRLHYHYVLAKDVHGVKWKFEHLLKGKPSRHYFLTRKWSQFVSRKNLVPGDTVVFIRGKNMKLRLGIKRVIQATNGVPDPIVRKNNTLPNILSPVAAAIFNKCTFDVFYSPRASHPEFVICYQKYMKSIRKRVCIGEKFQMQSEMDDSSEKRCSGVVTGTCDLDPNRWPSSKWRCLLVRWDKEIGNHEGRVSPWEIESSLSLPSSIHSSPRLKRQRTSLQENAPASSAILDCPESSLDLEDEVYYSDINAGPFDLNFELPAPAHHPLVLELPDPADHPLNLELQAPVPKNPVRFTIFPDEDCSLSLPSTIHSSPRLKRLRPSLQENSTATAATAGLDRSESSMASDCAIIVGDVNIPFDIELPVPPCHPLDLQLAGPEHHPLKPERQGPVPKNPLKPVETLEYLEIDSFSSLASFLRNELAARRVKQLKINKCPDLEVLIHRMAYTSLEYLEFYGCLFFPYSKRDYFPTTLKRLKICDCTNSELILQVLMIQKGLSLESLEIDGCSSLRAFPINKLPATLRRLKIVNCMNLKSLGESSKIRYFDSAVVGPEDDSSLKYITGTQTLDLRELEIWDCVELEFLPEGLHNFTCLDQLSISNCPSLESFPEGGLPNTSLTSLLISECESLKSLPHQIHKVTSLQNLSVSGCPSLNSFPQGGLPPNLISLGIIDCENLIPLSHWELHKLKRLRKYSIVGGRPNLGE